MPDLLTGNHDPPADANPPIRAPQSPIASWYTQGRSDGLGDRLLMFDNSGASALEVLRFRREFLDTPGFENALRARVEQLRGFRHPAFPKVRAVDFGPEGVALVSTHVPGHRLTEILDKAPGAAFAREVIRQLTPALAMLHEHGVGVAHGALAPDRIVVTPEGRLVIVEHALGSALARLDLPARRLWGELGVIAHPAADSKWDCRADVFQLGLIVLSVVLGRRVRPDEYPDVVPDLRARLALMDQPSPLTPLLPWLERALQLEGRLFESGRDALQALGEVEGAVAAQLTDDGRKLLSPPESAQVPAVRAATFDSVLQKWGTPVHEPGEVSPDSATQVVVPQPIDDALPVEAITPATVPPAKAVRDARSRRARSLIAGLAVLAVVEGILIGALLGQRIMPAAPVFAPVLLESPVPGADVWVNGERVGTTPLELKLGADTHTIRVLPPETRGRQEQNLLELLLQSRQAPAPEPADVQPVVTLPAAAPAPRTGGLHVSSSIELEVFEQGRFAGVSGRAPITLREGRHELDLVNGAFGYRSSHLVNIRAGEVGTLSVTPPMGIVHINALPWAEVWIDGALVGETPLANLSLVIGEHDVMFRHPTLGERRSTAIVRADDVTRVSVNLRE